MRTTGFYSVHTDPLNVLSIPALGKLFVVMKKADNRRLSAFFALIFPISKGE